MRGATDALAARADARAARKRDLEQWVAAERERAKRESLALHRDRRDKRNARVAEDRARKAEVAKLKNEIAELKAAADARGRASVSFARPRRVLCDADGRTQSNAAEISQKRGRRSQARARKERLAERRFLDRNAAADAKAAELRTQLDLLTRQNDAAARAATVGPAPNVAKVLTACSDTHLKRHRDV